MKIRLISVVVSAALLATVPALAFAGGQTAAPATSTAATPSKLVLDNSTRVLTTLEARRAEFTTDRAALQKFISAEFEQMFDSKYAAQLVLGRHGRGAADADVNRFAKALTSNLMGRYGSSLLDFNTRLKVRIKSETPLRGGAMVKVSSEFLRQGGDPIPVDYLMRKVGNDWKVFDVMVEGVSFVQTFRNQFDEPLARKSINEISTDLEAGRLQPTAK
ncbi:ABC transporter substrate-binding protein [Lysobacter sp. H23M47]|uniref:MlaC/ttg2D family ABC transporter substrate-binding protein n=1 Tax=Lysobacter sp. H23M47 TaxID=2781024 RepID=UPI001881930A|nr:ABC transporter substrate-binding protein [Lysobacter sp. H23M47]QOW24569.1 ABC transporter substrate-binding protein [Lysobacter sp. H23M47]